MEGAERIIMIKREDIDENVLISLDKRNENWQIVEDIKNDLATQKEDYANNVFKIKNEVVNGDFSNGTTNWNSANALISVENGTLYVNSNAGSSVARATYILDDLVAEENDKVFLSATVKASNNSVSLNIFDGAFNSVNHSGSGEWETLSLITKLTWSENSSKQIQLQRADAQSYWKNIIFINLTKFFGAGNEPTKEEMDLLLDILGGWLDGEVALSQKQIAIWTLNLIRQNRNAIISLGGTIV